MKFRYIGDSDNMTAYGYDFRDGATPDVTDANAIKRLSGNRFFEAVEQAPDQPIKPKREVDWNGNTIKKKPGRKPKAAQP